MGQIKGKVSEKYNYKQAACMHLNDGVVKISCSKIVFTTPYKPPIISYRCTRNCGYEKCVCCGGNSKEFVLLDE